MMVGVSGELALAAGCRTGTRGAPSVDKLADFEIHCAARDNFLSRRWILGNDHTRRTRFRDLGWRNWRGFRLPGRKDGWRLRWNYADSANFDARVLQRKRRTAERLPREIRHQVNGSFRPVAHQHINLWPRNAAVMCCRTLRYHAVERHARQIEMRDRTQSESAAANIQVGNSLAPAGH